MIIPYQWVCTASMHNPSDYSSILFLSFNSHKHYKDPWKCSKPLHWTLNLGKVLCFYVASELIELIWVLSNKGNIWECCSLMSNFSHSQHFRANYQYSWNWKMMKSSIVPNSWIPLSLLINIYKTFLIVKYIITFITWSDNLEMQKTMISTHLS